MKALTLGLFLLLVFSVATIPTVFADEDEWDDDEGEYEREAGEMAREQEREREHDDDDDEEGLAIEGGVSDAILYGTIAVIASSVGYTGYKIFKAKRPKLTLR